MAEEWDQSTPTNNEKLEYHIGEGISSDLMICSGVEITNNSLGRGLFGTVVEASWYSTACAAKQVHSKVLEPSRSTGFLSSFIRETSTWAKLKHPHITLLLGLFQTESSVFPLLVVEKLDTSLHDLLQDCLKGVRQLSLQQKVSILLQVALGLAYLHQLNPPAVHGNLTASNVLIELSSLTAKITDFGIARVIAFSDFRMPFAGHYSHFYVSPEILESPVEEALVSESDAFSYGVLIIHTVNHQLLKLLPLRVKQGKGLTYLSEFERRQNDLEAFPEEDKGLFSCLIEKCLEFSPEDRPNSLALVSNLQDIQSKVGPPLEKPIDLSKVSVTTSEQLGDRSMMGSDILSIPSKSAANEVTVELQICAKEEQLKKQVEELEEKREKLNKQRGLLEVTNFAIQQSQQEIVDYKQHCDSYKEMNFDDLSWQKSQYITTKDSSVSAFCSTNVAENGGTFFVGIQLSDSYSYGILKITVSPNSYHGNHGKKPSVSCSVTALLPNRNQFHNFALAISQDDLHMLGGEQLTYSCQPTGQYSRSVWSLSLQSHKWKEQLPPMKRACASPTAVTYKDRIIVMHKTGEMEVLDTSSPNPVWADILPTPYAYQTQPPSAVIVGDILVVWLGTFYFTNLQNMFGGHNTDDNRGALTASWATLPAPTDSTLPLHLTKFNDQLVAVVGKSMYAFSSTLRRWNNIDNQCGELFTVCVNLKTVMTIQSTKYERKCARVGIL